MSTLIPIPTPPTLRDAQVRQKGAAQFGTKVEVKNMNSFSNMQKAIEFEFDRQVCVVSVSYHCKGSPCLVVTQALAVALASLGEGR